MSGSKSSGLCSFSSLNEVLLPEQFSPTDRNCALLHAFACFCIRPRLERQRLGTASWRGFSHSFICFRYPFLVVVFPCFLLSSFVCNVFLPFSLDQSTQLQFLEATFGTSRFCKFVPTDKTCGVFAPCHLSLLVNPNSLILIEGCCSSLV